MSNCFVVLTDAKFASSPFLSIRVDMVEPGRTSFYPVPFQQWCNLFLVQHTPQALLLPTTQSFLFVLLVDSCLPGRFFLAGSHCYQSTFQGSPFPLVLVFFFSSDQHVNQQTEETNETNSWNELPKEQILSPQRLMSPLRLIPLNS